MAKNTQAAEAQVEEILESATEAEAPAETEQVAEPEVPKTVRELALAAKANTIVMAPIGNIETFVQHVYRTGGVLLTADGEGLYDEPCKHAKAGEQVPQEELVYFEFVGTDNDQENGFLHRKRGCQRRFVTRIGDTTEASTPAIAGA